MFDAVVLGAGLTGSILARRLAEEKQAQVLVVEKRPHLGGDCYDYRDENGILVHRYGPHIFRTGSAQVHKYLSRFTAWTDYQHKVLAYVGGHMYPMPINLDTVNRYFCSSFTTQTVRGFFDNLREDISPIKNVRDMVVSQVGPELYEAFFKNYTHKQWGVPAEELPPEIVARIPIRTSRDDRYFTVPYQCIPSQGYTKMIEAMLQHPAISLMLNTNGALGRSLAKKAKLYYTGSIDEYYEHRFGKLPYRSVHFTFETLETPQFQPAAVVNYPNDYEYTRITEFKHFLPCAAHKTVIAKEFSSAKGEPSYPIPTKENKALYAEYKALAQQEKNVVFAGRLGRYQYFSMDQIVQDALDITL